MDRTQIAAMYPHFNAAALDRAEAIAIAGKPLADAIATLPNEGWRKMLQQQWSTLVMSGIQFAGAE